jgi:hypothetical protein
MGWIWNGLKWVVGINVDLKRVGYIPVVNQRKEMTKHPWPTFITGGDISRDGKLITLRSYNSMYTFLN